MSSNSSSPITPALQDEINNSLGSVFIGLVISAAIFGITNVQCYFYYQKSDRDPLWLKLVIALCLVFDWLHIIFTTHGVYTYVISNFANLEFLSHTVWSFAAQVVVSAVSDFTVQLCFCRRIWIMSKRSWLVTGVGVVFAALCCAFSLTFGILLSGYTSVDQYSQASWALYCASATAVAGDLWIALALCYFLAKSRTGWKASDSIATRLMAYIINTGLLTTMVVTASFITFATMPNSNVYIAIYLSYSKLYFNALLAMFNARDRLARGMGASSNAMYSSNDTPINLSRIRGRGKQQDAVADVQIAPQVSFGQIESVSRRADTPKADLKRSPSGGVIVTVSTDIMQHADLDHDTDDGQSDKFRPV